MIETLSNIRLLYLGNDKVLKGALPEAVPTVTFAMNIASNARVFASTDSRSVQHCVGDRNSCSDLVRGSCRSTSDDVEYSTTPPNKIQPWERRVSSIGGGF